MANLIKSVLIIVMYTSFISFLLTEFVEVLLFLSGGVGGNVVQVIRGSVLLTVIGTYVIGVVWSRSQIGQATYFTTYQKMIAKKMILTKPFTGIAIYCLASSPSRLNTFLLRRGVIGAFYYGRKTSIVLLLGTLLTFPIFQSVVLFVVFAGAIILTIVMHILFELSVLLCIFEKGDQEIASEERYFNAIQWSFFPYSEYYKNI